MPDVLGPDACALMICRDGRVMGLPVLCSVMEGVSERWRVMEGVVEVVEGGGDLGDQGWKADRVAGSVARE